MVNLGAGHLVGGGAKAYQEICRRFHQGGSRSRSAPAHGRAPFWAYAIREGFWIADLETSATLFERHYAGGVGLQPDQVGSCLGGRHHDRQSPFQSWIVIATHFGNHKGWWSYTMEWPVIAKCG